MGASERKSRWTTRWAAVATVVVVTLPVTVAGADTGTADATSAVERDAGHRPPGAIEPDGGIAVFGHRGATGYRPEHTVGSYELAVQLGADFIEPDLVVTADGHLVARHENEIATTTDVADHPEFADRHTTKVIDGVEHTGWFTEDFTLAELKTLRVVERIPDQRSRNTLYDGRYEILTLQEILDLAEELGRRHGRIIGVMPEVKHPTYYEEIGLGFERPLIRTIKRNRLEDGTGRFIVQSNEPTILRRLDRRVDVDLMQSLLNAGDAYQGAPYDTVARGKGPTYDEMATPEGLAEIATYADWFTAQKNRFIPRVDGELGPPSSLADDVREVGLKVSVYTFRNENSFLPPALRVGDDPNEYGDAFAEYAAFLALDLDGLFSDNPDTAILARTDHLAGTGASAAPQPAATTGARP